MRFLVHCQLPDVPTGTKCNHVFSAHDEVPGDNDYLCPRCGKRPCKIIFTSEQMKKHVPYRHLGHGEIVRVGLEAKLVQDQGYFVIDEKTGQPIRYDIAVPRFN